MPMSVAAPRSALGSLSAIEPESSITNTMPKRLGTAQTPPGSVGPAEAIAGTAISAPVTTSAASPPLTAPHPPTARVLPMRRQTDARAS